MYPSLRFCGRYALHAVHARFIFQCAVYIVARHGADNFLETAGCTFVGAGYLHSPSLGFAVLGVHAEEVAGKDCRFVTTRAATNFEDGITAILRVGGDEQQLYLLFQFRLAGLAGIQLFACHFPHFLVCFVGDNFFGFFYAAQYLHVLFAGIHQVAQFFIFFGELDVTLLVRNHCRVCNQGRHFFEAGDKPFQLFEYGIVVCHIFNT